MYKSDLMHKFRSIMSLYKYRTKFPYIRVLFVSLLRNIAVNDIITLLNYYRAGC